MADCDDPACAAACAPRCGNAKVEATEGCDDGNATDGDGCDSNCKPTACGNGVMTTNERCDDGNAINGDGCDVNCTPTGCGNGVMTGTEGCDDGNATNLDGCSAACAPEPLEVEPNEDGSASTGGSGVDGNDFASASADTNGAFTGSVVIRSALTPAGDEDVFKFTNTTAVDQDARFDTWNRALGLGVSCGTATIDTGINIRGAAGALLARNDDRAAGTDLCSTVRFRIPAGQSIYVHVVESGDNAVIAGYALQATIRPVACGDGNLAPGEDCDDGNLAPGDGCSAACVLEGTAAEIEPNDSIAQAMGFPVTGNTLLEGSFPLASDVDFYELTVATGTVVKIEAVTAVFDCFNATLDVRLLDMAGTQIIGDTADSLGIDSCGSITAFLAPGTYYINIKERLNATVPKYFVQVTYQTDRGAETEPANMSGVNDTVATAAASLMNGNHVFVFGDHTLASDADVYSITVPPGKRVRAELIEGNRAVETCESDDADTLLTLFDQGGAMLVADDDDGRGRCSLIDGTGVIPRDAAARNATASPQTYYLMVQSSTSATGTARQFVYRLQVELR